MAGHKADHIAPSNAKVKNDEDAPLPLHPFSYGVVLN
jgi:hypothetical protein